MENSDDLVCVVSVILCLNYCIVRFNCSEKSDKHINSRLAKVMRSLELIFQFDKIMFYG